MSTETCDQDACWIVDQRQRKPVKEHLLIQVDVAVSSAASDWIHLSSRGFSASVCTNLEEEERKVFRIMTDGSIYTSALQKFSVVLLFSALILDPCVNDHTATCTLGFTLTGCARRCYWLHVAWALTSCYLGQWPPVWHFHDNNSCRSVAMLNVFLESFVAAAQSK